jgi:hypothetical protein
MPFRLIFVFEAVVAEPTRVLLLQFVRSVVFYRSVGYIHYWCGRRDGGTTRGLPQLLFAFKFLGLFRAALAHERHFSYSGTSFKEGAVTNRVRKLAIFPSK